MKMDDEKFYEWYRAAAPEEKRLVDKVNELDELFADMLFRPGTYTYPLVYAPREGEPVNGKQTSGRLQLPPPLEYYLYTYFHFKVFQPGDEENDGIEGYFNTDNQELGVRADKLEADSTILHELIHLHEFVLMDEAVPPYYRDMLFWAMYRQVRKRIPRLDEMIFAHAHVVVQEDITTIGGLHDVLFLLKSLELDMRMGYKLGTVFEYGRTDEFKDYSYKPYGRRRIHGEDMNKKNKMSVKKDVSTEEAAIRMLVTPEEAKQKEATIRMVEAPEEASRTTSVQMVISKPEEAKQTIRAV